MIVALLVLARALHIGSAMMLVALPYFAGVILRPGAGVSPMEGAASFQATIMRWLWGAWLLEGLSGVAWFWLVAAQMSDQPSWTLLDPSALNAVLWQMQFGRLWLMRGLMGIALGLAIYLNSRDRPVPAATSFPWPWLLMGLGSCLLATLAWAGHAVAGIHDRILHLGVDALHLLTGAVWPIGLIPLALFLRQVNRRDQTLSPDYEIAALQRFSQGSFIAVLVLVMTGLVNSWLMIGSWRALVTTTYGELLLAKVILVAILIGLGAFNRLHLLPRLRETPRPFQTLRGTVALESCLALVILFIVGVMGMTSPP